ncbi:polyubiquitin 12-like [Oryza brachyantha]|uniref:Ubiquitin-like domain-containing protein n=1 Tax=Oryza brachyantha TaxID=4533 RepID=J3N3D7_ORYBR|nr:polyubiquitin 12-like [Oryza brachyantha]
MKHRAAMDSHHEQQQPPSPQRLKIYVKMTKTFTLNVDCTDTVSQIKSKLSAIEGIDESKQEMFFDGMHMKNEDTLADYNIMTNSSVDLYVTDGIQISVKIPSVGKTIKLNVRKLSAVADVKAEIEQKEGILINEQILMYAGRQLEDNHILSQCDLRNGQSFHVLVCPSDNLRVFINVGGDKTLSLETKCWYTVADVKLMIENLEGLPTCSQILSRVQSGVRIVLDDSEMLQDQHVKNNDTLSLEYSIHFFVKTWEGKTLTMIRHMSDTGKEIMDTLKGKIRIKESLVYLSHMGRILSPGDTLQKHQVKNNSTIYIRYRNSGMFQDETKGKK